MPASVMVFRFSRVCPGVTIALGLFVPATEKLNLTTGLSYKRSSHCQSPLITPHAVNLKGFKYGKPEAVLQQNKEGKDLMSWFQAQKKGKML